MKKSYIYPHTAVVHLTEAEGLLAPISDTTVSGSKGGWVKAESTADSPDASPWDYQWEEE